MRPEKWLNAFVRFIALLERMGNALGTLAFIWATTVVLGGFSEHLGEHFWYGTAIVFLEGFRTFSRQTKRDDRLLFKTTDSIKFKRVHLGINSSSLYYANAVLMMLSIYIVSYAPFLSSIILSTPGRLCYELTLLLAILLMIYKKWFHTFIGYISRKESPILLQFCSPVAVLITRLGLHCSSKRWYFDRTDYTTIPLWFLMYIVARFGSPDKRLFLKGAARVFLVILLIAVIWEASFGRIGICLSGLFGVFVVGSLQTQMAEVQILLSYACLFIMEIEVNGTDNKNVKLSLKILYTIVFSQGVLYMAACILESFSFVLRRSLAVCCGLTDISGMKAIDLYYEQCYDRFLHDSLLDTTQKRELVSFAIDSLNPKAPRHKKRAALRILDSFLKKHKTSSFKSDIVSLITASNKVVMTLISILGWKLKEDEDMRLFAAKVVAYIAPYQQINEISGAIRQISSLLDSQVDGDGGITHNSKGSSSQTVGGNGRNIHRQQRRTPDIEGGNRPEPPDSTLVCKFFHFLMKGWEEIHKLWQHLEKLKSVPHKDSKDTDSLSALGLQILEGFAHDLQNCEEICRTELLRKIVRLSCIPGTTAVQREEITTSSLRLIAKLAGVKGEIGIKLRQGLTEDSFLLVNLIEILELEGSSSYLELVMNIIASISVDKKTRQKIGTVPVVINKLLKEFIGEEGSSKPLRAEAGEALAMLAIDCPDNCCAMLDKANYELIGDLTSKLQCGHYLYPTARLMQSLCKNSSQLVLSYQGSNDCLLSTLTAVLGRIVDAEGKEMAALIGLASQTCSALSEHIAAVLDSSDGAFVKKIVGELDACKKASPDEFADMTRMLVELTISVVESCPRYTLNFKEHGMVEVLCKLQLYMRLVVPEEQGALCAMVARAKELIEADQHGGHEIVLVAG